MKRLRLTNLEIMDSIISVYRYPSIYDEKSIKEQKRRVDESLEPLLAPIQIVLNDVNGRAFEHVISRARWLFDVVSEVEIELRTKGVTIKNMKNTSVYYCGAAGYKGVTTGVHLKRYATGWFVTDIEKTYEQRSKRLVSITPEARANIINAQLGQYGEVPENT
jgi:hypothetical protein